MGYTTAELIQSELRASEAFASTTVPSLTDVTTWIEEESAQIDDDLGYSLAATQYDELYDYTSNENSIYTKVSPVISVDTLSYNSYQLGTSDYSTGWTDKVEDTDFTVYLNKGKIDFLTSNFSPQDGAKKIRLIYTAGYTSTPLVVQKLATKMTSLRILNTLISSNVNDRNDGGSISVGSISIVEPVSYGVSSYKTLQDDVKELQDKVLEGFGVMRYGAY